VLKINIKNGEEYPILSVNWIKPDSRQDWSDPSISTCINFLTEKLFYSFKKV
jgi:hypothetical protein